MSKHHLLVWSINRCVVMSGRVPKERRHQITYPSTAGERSGRLLPLDLYLLWLCRRGGRPGPQWSPAPSRPPMGPPRPAGTDPPTDPPPSIPRSLTPPRRPPGSRGSESGLSLSAVNGRSSNKRCHNCRDVEVGQRKKREKLKTYLYPRRSPVVLPPFMVCSYLCELCGCVIYPVCAALEETERSGRQRGQNHTLLARSTKPCKLNFSTGLGQD